MTSEEGGQWLKEICCVQFVCYYTWRVRGSGQNSLSWNGGSSRKCWSRDVGVEHDPQLFLDMLISVCSPLGVIVDVLPPG